MSEISFEERFISVNEGFFKKCFKTNAPLESAPLVLGILARFCQY
jgi:hypothetical protein